MMTKSKAIVVLNADSSSLNFSQFDVTEDCLRLIVRGQVQNLGDAACFKAMDHNGTVLAHDELGKQIDHNGAFAHLSAWLQERYGSLMVMAAVGHHITHGGADFGGPTIIDDDVVARLEALIPLAPLRQPHNLAAVMAVKSARPDVLQVACCDTSFHRGRALVTERYGLPRKCFDAGLKRWGFHGLSYESVLEQFRARAPHLASGRVIVAHLGSNASLCGMKAGRSVDATMSFSTLDGLPMATRCGSIDPGALLFLLGQMTPARLSDMLYKESGLLGVSGISGDMRVLLASKEPAAAEAVDYFVHRVIREIGALTATLGGLDAVIFTAGIGENSPVIRERICRGLSWLGVAIDPRSNERSQGCISPAGRSPSVWVVAKDEEGIIAARTRDLLARLPVRTARWRGGRSHAML